MQINLNNKYAIVTGGTKGIGKQISKRFLELGAYVTATYAHDENSANLFLEENKLYKDKINIAKFDVSNFEEVESFFKQYTSTYERIDILVNNSGIKRDQIIMSMEANDFNKVLQTNLNGTFNMSKLALYEMLKNRFGRIINISSIAAHLNLSGQGNYSASKAAINSLTKTMSKEVAKKNITVNSICPGFIETEMLSDMDPELLSSYKKQVPMKRFGRPEEVADLVSFLASDFAAYITGSDISISGGL